MIARTRAVPGRSLRAATWILAVLALAGAVAVVGLAAYVRRASSATPAGVRPARPATLLPTRPPAYPLRVGPTGRYLVDRNGRPFLIVGDSPQALIANVSETQADRFFANRQAAGFNSVWINLLCDDYTGGRPDGTTYDGIAPFTRPGDLSTPNPSYFARVDDMIRLAAKHRLAVFLDPIETGGWLKRPAKQRHGQGLRLRSLPGAAVQAVPEHRLAQRQRFPDVEPAGGRCSGAGRRQGHQVRRSGRTCRPLNSTSRPAPPSTTRGGGASSGSTPRTPTPRRTRRS